MGIEVEFNPGLALRKTKTPRKLEEECIPKKILVGNEYGFLKQGQRVFYMKGEIPLMTTEGNGKTSRPIASVKIIEATHYNVDGEVFTKGKYIVTEIYDVNDTTIHFEGFEKIK